jgi:hypothetical protein
MLDTVVEQDAGVSTASERERQEQAPGALITRFTEAHERNQARRHRGRRVDPTDRLATA